MLNDNHYTKEAYEDNGRFQIHPLNAEGFEAYLSKDSYNYHYLKSRYNPLLMQQIEEELKADKEQKIKKNQNNEQQNKIQENPKTEDVKIPNNISKKDNIKKNELKNNNNKITSDKNSKINANKGKNKINNNIKKNQNFGNNNMNQIKIGNVGRAMNPVISNVKNDRGRLKDFQQPYHA